MSCYLLYSTLNITKCLWFQGYLVGNPCTDANYDGDAIVAYAHGFGFISDELYEVRDLWLQIFIATPYQCVLLMDRMFPSKKS